MTRSQDLNSSDLPTDLLIHALIKKHYYSTVTHIITLPLIWYFLIVGSFLVTICVCVCDAVYFMRLKALCPSASSDRPEGLHVPEALAAGLTPGLEK